MTFYKLTIVITSFLLIPSCVTWFRMFEIESISNLSTDTGTEASIIQVDPNKEIGEITHFWKSTGFCPPLPHNESSQWFVGEDMTQNLIFIGALPYAAVDNVRIHYLLEALTVSRLNNDVPVYNFTLLDKLIDNLWSNGLKPGFELMGNPSRLFNDFTNKTQVWEWRRLVFLTARRYIKRYGVDYVRLWLFESWNEPKKRVFANINMTLQGFLNYYDACDSGLNYASPLLQFGGPGGELHELNNKSYSWALLNHTVHGTNYFTNKTGTRIDFISIHKKGEEPDNTKAIFDKENTFKLQLKNYLPELIDKPIFNDEADPLVTWSRPLWWRQDATYAAMVAKVIITKQVLHKPSGYLLSNDNGFLSYNPNMFSQRTLLARFQMNNTRPPHVQMIRKPVYNVMALLSILGDHQLETQLSDNIRETSDLKDLDLLATVHHPEEANGRDSWQLCAFIYYSKDSHFDTVNNTQLTLHMHAVDNAHNLTDTMYTIYRLDNSHGNSYGAWQALGSPDTPSWKQLNTIRQNEEPVRVIAPSPLNMSVDQQLPISIALPGVTLLHICSKPLQPPAQVKDVRLHNITAGQVLIYWDGTHSYCLQTYKVEFCPSQLSSRCIRLNAIDTIFNSYIYAPDPDNAGVSLDVQVCGTYRVQAVDYWGRHGPYSHHASYCTAT